MRTIIFSDVDGCLIGQGPTCFTKITEAIKRVSESFIVILATGKTAHEIIRLNHYLQLPGPFIVENGHGILFKSPFHVGSVDISSFEALRPAACPRDPEILLSAQAWCTEIDRTGSRGQAAGRRDLKCQQTLIFSSSKWMSLGDYSLLSFGEKKPDMSALKSIIPLNALLTEMDDEYLAFLTGMSVEDAYLAKQRFFTEPIYIKDLSQNELNILKKQLFNKKLYYSQSSRFLHVTKSLSNKGRAIRFLLQSFFFEEINKTYAIGDSLNDFSMFAQCEKNYYISNQPCDALPERCDVILEKELSGWLKVMSEIT